MKICCDVFVQMRDEILKQKDTKRLRYFGDNG